MKSRNAIEHGQPRRIFYSAGNEDSCEIKKHLSFSKDRCNNLRYHLDWHKICPALAECRHTPRPITPALRHRILRAFRLLWLCPPRSIYLPCILTRLPPLPGSLYTHMTVLSPRHWFHGYIKPHFDSFVNHFLPELFDIFFLPIRFFLFFLCILSIPVERFSVKIIFPRRAR